ncbi:MAG: phosphoribosylaminoimidazolesuccinocarboxamide synthase [Acidobacteriota bacterium]|nr:phosphoribosylaminoimidazolesuccinocarboxamide synthase [Acidobacteriota bacterium]
MTKKVVTHLELEGFTKVASGKVREIFDLGDSFLFVASDRISAFDVVLPNGIPHKGQVLTQLSKFWFSFLGDSVENHLISADPKDLPAALAPYHEELEGRFMIVRKLEMIPVECVVRGYLVGSGFKEYRQSGTVCGIRLPEGMECAQKLETPIFTPAAKATDGHDENISFEKMCEMVGEDLSKQLRDLSIDIYSRAAQHAAGQGVIIADTKFEFGMLDGRIVLADEVLTPDSSRYWPEDEYVTGKNPPSFDKQFVRDYLSTLDWDKNPPGPTLPDEIISGTTDRYLEAYRRIVGHDL